MDINALLLCDSAEVVDDRLQIRDGGWDGLKALAWPAGHDIQVVALLAPAPEDVGKDLAAVVLVMGPGGAEAGRTEATLLVERHREQVPVVLPVFGEFETSGRYSVVVTVAGARGEASFQLDGPAPDVRVQEA